MKLLFYDWETDGLPLWDKPSDDPGQPHVVQLGAVLVDGDTRQIVSTIDLIAKPVDWVIPDDVAAIHGITTDYARHVGLPEQFLVHCLWSLWELCDVRIGHNESFDARITRIALKRYFEAEGEELPPGFSQPPSDEWKAGKAECTANMATKIMKMPATEKMRASGRNFNKKPKLTEAYEYFKGQPLADAHKALADALATMEIYWAMKDIEGGGTAPAEKGETVVPFLGKDDG